MWFVFLSFFLFKSRLNNSHMPCHMMFLS
jgi:hypothetical protein